MILLVVVEKGSEQMGQRCQVPRKKSAKLEFLPSLASTLFLQLLFFLFSLLADAIPPMATPNVGRMPEALKILDQTALFSALS